MPTNNNNNNNNSKPNKATNYSNNNKKKKNDQAIKKEFEQLDKDNSGFIDKADLKKLCSFIPDALLTKAISIADKNDDGKISFDEYKKNRAEATKLMSTVTKFGSSGGNKKT